MWMGGIHGSFDRCFFLAGGHFDLKNKELGGTACVVGAANMCDLVGCLQRVFG